MIWLDERYAGYKPICVTACYRATDGTRTHDLLITSELLYQLSYGGLKEKANIRKEMVSASVSL